MSKFRVLVVLLLCSCCKSQSEYYEDEDTVVILAPPTSELASETPNVTYPNRIVTYPSTVTVSLPFIPSYYPLPTRPPDVIIGPSNSLSQSAQNCLCVPVQNCQPGVNSSSNGIDIRIVTPVHGNCLNGYVLCCNTMTCGLRTKVANAPKPPNSGYAPYAHYPWMTAILTEANEYIGGGVLLDEYHVLTAAHKIASFRYNLPSIKLRFGEWDSSSSIEPYPYVESAIHRVWIHHGFDPVNLYNDIAMVRLKTSVPVNVSPNINSVCLPPNSTADFNGQRCWVAGWGKNSISGTFETMLKHVQVTVVDGHTCESSMKRTRLGNNFQLDQQSFICAGGELNKDACTGDGGSPLVCHTNGRWILAGLVAWGIGCAQPGIYGAYVNVPNFLPWIQHTLSISNK